MKPKIQNDEHYFILVDEFHLQDETFDKIFFSHFSQKDKFRLLRIEFLSQIRDLMMESFFD